MVSPLELGTVIRDLPAELASSGGWILSSILDRATCQVIVAFDPSCPFCRQAADEEARVSSEDRLPTTWVAPGDSIGAIRYRDYVGEGTRVTKSSRAWEELKVQGVPAGFLLDVTGAVRYVWPYRGMEGRKELEARCRRGPNHPLLVE